MPTRTFDHFHQTFDHVIFDFVSSILREKAEEISQTFYSELMQDNDAQLYLNNEIVEHQLSRSFAKWAQDIFCPYNEFDPSRLTKTHTIIGEVHARIGIPMRLVDLGMQVVKDFCFRTILTKTEKSEDLSRSVLFINNLLDTSLSVINQSYFDRTLENERTAQTLRMRMSAPELNIECERVKTDLMEWSRDLIGNIATGRVKTYLSISNVYSTKFGLWVNHKAALYFPDFDELPKLRTMMSKADELCRQGRSLFKEYDQFNVMEFLSDLNQHVNECVWLIDQIIEKNSKENDSKDPLTKLLSRRYVDSILKREVEVSMKQKQPFCVMMLDLDNFKGINDAFGHTTGDTVLREVSNTILHNLRPTDFCFRYGGEEILIVMSHMTASAALQKAEHIRRTVANMALISERGEAVPVTTSIGLALHKGHPDYQQTINVADERLYEAKNTGKNKVIFEDCSTA